MTELIAPVEALTSRRNKGNLWLLQIAQNPAPRMLATELRDPLDDQRESADLHMCFYAPGRPVLQRGHLDSGFLQRPKAALNDHQPLVPTGGIFQADGFVVGLHDPIAVVAFGLLDRVPLSMLTLPVLVTLR
jgi:hypothetical protein